MFNFYPILRAPNCNGFTVVHNYSPNNWEIKKNFDKCKVTFVKDTFFDAKNINKKRRFKVNKKIFYKRFICIYAFERFK